MNLKTTKPRKLASIPNSRKHQKSTTARENKSNIDKENTYSPDNEATPGVRATGGNGAGNQRMKGLAKMIDGIGDGSSLGREGLGK